MAVSILSMIILKNSSTSIYSITFVGFPSQSLKAWQNPFGLTYYFSDLSNPANNNCN